jgi:hypothetical protein
MPPPLAQASAAPRSLVPEKPFAPQAFLHRGVVLASAFLVDPALLGLREARRRIIDTWTPGATVHRVGIALLIRLPAPRWIDCARAPGLPLLPLGEARQDCAPTALAALPLTKEELARISPLSPDAVVQMRHGALTVERHDDADIEDPASYLDLSRFEAIPVTPLGAPPPLASIVATHAPADTRALFGVEDPPEELTALLESLQNELARRERRAAESSSRAGGAGAFGAGSRALSLFRALLLAFASLFSFLADVARALLPPRARPTPSGSSRDLPSPPAPAKASSFADRVAKSLRHWLVSLLIRARLSRIIGRKQAEYVQRMMEMFERGDLTEALRHAIPLGGKDGLPASPALGVPSARADLRISLGSAVSSSALLLGGDLWDQLQRLYRAAFERLSGEGRIEEAAFILAELLQSSEEAVAFLERHGRTRAAAELAEARELPPGLVVRQWFLAGERARAVRIARRFRAFSDALLRLKGHPEEPELRCLWAEELAETGNYAAAVEVIWPIAGEQKRAAAWIEAAIEQGGEPAARMLVRKIALLPETFHTVRAQVLALLRDRTPNAPTDRRAFANALLHGPRTPATEVLARPAARALVEDGARFGDSITQTLVSQLAAFSGDDALRIDLPTWPAVVRPWLRSLDTKRSIAIDAADTGTLPVFDAAYLPNGQIALALGEAGVRVLRRRPDDAFFHLDQPAHHLVVADRGDRALALASRDEAFRVARLDLIGRRTEVWCEAIVTAFAPDFDGAEWVVADSNRLLSIDAADPRFEALRAFPLDGHAFRIARSPSACAVFAEDRAERGGLWLRFELPEWTLRARKPCPLTEPDFKLGQGFGLHTNAVASLAGPARLTLRWSNEADTERRLDLATFADPPLSPSSIELCPGWVACAFHAKAGVVVRLFDDIELKERATITLGGARNVCLRLWNETLTVGDDRGRVLVIELAHGSVIRSIRT